MINKSFKILLCTIILYMSFVVFPMQSKQKVEAALPLAAWAVAVLGNILLDTAVDMGLDFVDDKAKTKWKDKKVGELWNKYGDKLKDLVPTKKNLGKWIFKSPKWLMAAVIDLIDDEIEDVIEQDTKRKEENKKPIENKIDYDEIDPFYKTGVGVTIIPKDDAANALKGYVYLTEYGNITLKPLAYEQSSEMTICIVDECETLKLFGDDNYTITTNGYHVNNGDNNGLAYTVRDSYGGVKGDYIFTFPKGVSAFEKALEILEQKSKKVYQADGVLVTDGYDSYFDLPDNDADGNEVVYSPDVLQKLDEKKYPMIQEKEFEFDFGDDFQNIDVDYELINEGDEVSWEIIEKDIENNSNNYDKVINYDYEPTINNYYEISNPDDLKQDIEIIIKNEIDSGKNGSGNWSGEITIEGPYYCVDSKTKLPTSCKEVEAVDGSLLDFAKNSYKYATDTIETGVDGLKSLGDSARAVTGLYETFFGWLPKEIRTLMIGGFSLVIGIGIFRAFRR